MFPCFTSTHPALALCTRKRRAQAVDLVHTQDHGMSKEQAKRVLRIEADAIIALIGRIDDRFEQAVDIVLGCKGRVVVTGMGKSGLIGKKIAATLTSTGTPAQFLHPAEGIHGDLGMVTRGDMIIAISNSGETEEIAKMLPSFKRLGIKVIALTGNMESTLAKNSDVVIDVSVREEACPLGLAPTASTTATLAMGDALAVALLDKRGFKKEDFACFHPGGTLGKRLLLRVTDLMHTGDAIPVVSEETMIKDAIYEISSKKMGVTSVLNAAGKLVGVISDGDLRRWMEKTEKTGGNLLTKKAKEIMTKNPKVISKEALAAEAVALMEKNSITCLMITNNEKKPEGVLHLHDLLKAGVV
jgi:arabinose-5-phosphate isomerase